jgi:hypothetical protein
MCSKYINHFKVHLHHNWEGLCDHLKMKISYDLLLLMHLNFDSKYGNDHLGDSQLLSS